jgi:23S rRNA (adenine2503-C2)-methyltransferase
MDYKLASSSDGTKLITFKEGFKSVIIPAKDDKNAVCLSSQIGCQMNCAFCRAGKFKRNLTSDEIYAQAKIAQDIIKCKPTSIVIMGMGEPMLNFKEVNAAIDRLNKDMGISYKRITLSTCGVNLDLLKGAKFLIAISLHSPRDDVRQRIMPGACPVKEVVDFANIFKDNKNGVMMEYALMDGINDSDDDLALLLSLDWPKNAVFNILEFNDHNCLKKSGKGHYHKFWEALVGAGFKCFVRESRGKDIEAACGMLEQK